MVPNPISGLFGKSPIKPMEQHMEKAYACAAELREFFEAVLAQDWTRAAASQQRIVALENQADDLKRALRVNLPKSLFLPVPRSDLLDLLSIQDHLANETKDIAGLMLGRRMEIPEPIAPLMKDYIEGAIATCAQAQTAVCELGELLEAGFRGREVDIVETLIHELDRLEHEHDQLQIAVRAKLFTIEKSLHPVDVMFLYKIIDWIGRLANHAQKVGSRLQVLLAR